MSQNSTVIVEPKTGQVNLSDGVALQTAGRLDEAARIYRAVLKAHPGNANAWNLLGTVSIEKGELARARALIGKAVSVDGRSAASHHNLGVLLRQLGEMGDSQRHLEEAIRLKPDYAEAYYNYSASRRFEPDDPIVATVETLSAHDHLSTADRCFLHFAAGKMRDDMGEVERAFAHFHEGNRLKAADFDASKEARAFDDLKEVFGRGLFDRLYGLGDASEVPVFVVGMPRSGTTLVEQVLASHPRVFGAGELRDISAIAGTLPRHGRGEEVFPSCVREIDAKVLSGFAASYLKRVCAMAPDATRIVDKHPLNFRFLGLIAILFPKARIIHCTRSPLDTCLSCYFQNFRTGQYYSFDLAHLAHFHGLYHDLMAHWRAVLPVPVFELRYEDLIEDQEKVTRDLLSFCGLSWDPRCERFFETKRTVQTASSWQVRQPIYRSSIGRWKAYEAQLEPLIQALGPLADL